eukprot:Hpha_TRINITY_DN36500_c0_g1::TRINITY_DN36500_c0_g1_i1::g.130685::m.130685
MLLDRVLDILTGCLQRKDDSQMNHFIKRMLSPLVYLGLILCAGTFADGLPDVIMQFVPMSVATVGCLAYIIAAAFGYRNMGLLLDFILPLWVCTSCSYDSLQAALGKPRFWPLVVLMLDIALVYDRPRVPPIALAITLTYLLFESIERATRYGLYDYTGT